MNNGFIILEEVSLNYVLIFIFACFTSCCTLVAEIALNLLCRLTLSVVQFCISFLFYVVKYLSCFINVSNESCKS
jgi:hypothetical protein